MKFKKLKIKIANSDLKYETNKYLFISKKFPMISSFDDRSFSSELTTIEADGKQSNIMNTNLEFNNKARPISKEHKKKKRDTYKTVNALYEGHNEFNKVTKRNEFYIYGF